jgi:hypothetical protein
MVMWIRMERVAGILRGQRIFCVFRLIFGLKKSLCKAVFVFERKG